MATEGGSHGGARQPGMESTPVQRTTDSPAMGVHDVVLGAPAVQQGGGGSSRIRRVGGRRHGQVVAPARPHYRAMDYWDRSFPEISSFVKEEVYRSAIHDQKKRTIVRAGVKSGKRLVAQCLAAYTDDSQIKNVFLTAYVRKADSSQRTQLESYMTGGVFPISSKTKAIKCKKAIEELIRQHPAATILVHYDEFDHGSGSDQLIGASKLWHYMVNNSHVRIVLYSASPEEGLLEQGEDTRCLTMPIHANYRGAQYFLNNGLMHEAEPPLKYDKNTKEIIGLGDQLTALLSAAREHVSNTSKNQQRNLVIVRVTDGFTELYSKHHTIPGLMFDETQTVHTECRFVSSTVSADVKWDDYTYWNREMQKTRVRREVLVVFIDQMCTRSTDWFCHPFLFAYHDYHGYSSPLNTIIQSNLRAAYYLKKKNDNGEEVYGNEEHPIQLYGCVEVIEFVAGVRELANVSRSVSSRATVRTSDPGEYGVPIRVSLPNEILEDPRITQSLNGAEGEQTRIWLKSVLLAIPSLKASERSILAERALATKRTYGADSGRGGIHTVHGRYIEERESGPGGGLDTSSDYYMNRENYFWLDIAREDTENIPRGTAYITYGFSDEVVEEEYEHRLARDRENRPRSIFGH